MKKIILKPERISGDNFLPFGIYIRPGEPNFTCEGFDWHECLAAINLGITEIGFVNTRSGDLTQRELERHVNTKEVIIPVNGDLILVLAKGEADKESDFAAFYLPSGTAAVLNEGIWHYAPKPVSQTGGAFILYTEKTGSIDKSIINLAERGFDAEVAL